jgi:peptidoglycan/LPS O-acetylase OafA/YrhL
MESRKRIPELDGVRGLAVLLVVLTHYFVLIAETKPDTVFAYLQLALGTAYTGVDLFFVLSGFLIGGILLDNRKSGNYFQAFYARRFFRIFPLYYLFLSVSAIWLWARAVQSPADHTVSAMPFLFYLTYTQNFMFAARGIDYGYPMLAVTWSLAIEEQFYLAVPWLVRRVSDRTLIFALVAIIFIAYFSRLLMMTFQPDWDVAAYVLTYCRADTLACGILAALIVRRTTLPRLPLYIGWGGLALVMALMIRQRMLPTSPGIIYYGYTAFALFYTLTILLAVTHKTGPLAFIFRFAPLRHLGTLAYCIYLIHIPINGICHYFIRHQPQRLASAADVLTTLLGFALTVAIAQLSWIYFERPLLQKGHKFRYGVKSVTA